MLFKLMDLAHIAASRTAKNCELSHSHPLRDAYAKHFWKSACSSSRFKLRPMKTIPARRANCLFYGSMECTRK